MKCSSCLKKSRLGREAIETAYALKQIVAAGVRVFFYFEDRERTLDSPTDKIMLSLTAFADELEREKARQRTYDAMVRKARAGHVCGGKTFGYENVDILTSEGQRSHVERRVNEAEAAVVRSIFERYAAGEGLTRIVKRLNAEGVPAPRPQQDRPAGWAPSSVRAVLLRPLYRGEIVWNRTRKRNRWGQHRQHARPAGEWLHKDAPELRIVSDALWHEAHRQMAKRKSTYAAGRRPNRQSSYLLSGFARCAVCGGGFASHLRTHGPRGKRQRARFYACTGHWKRGQYACRNRLVGRMDLIDAEVLSTLQDDVLRPSVIERAVALALEELNPARVRHEWARVEVELEKVNAECQRLAEAIGTGRSPGGAGRSTVGVSGSSRRAADTTGEPPRGSQPAIPRWARAGSARSWPIGEPS